MELLRKYSIFLVFMLFVALSHLTGFASGQAIGSNFISFIKEMVVVLPLMFILVGLFDVWVPRSSIEKHIGQGAGAKGTVLVIILAMLQAGPLYGAFPFAYMLWKKGSSVRNIFTYLGAYSSIKIPMLSFEVGFMGWEFSLLRSAATVPVFIAAAFLMEALLKGKSFEIKNPQ
jgi:uncharacterized membrane protein YraQ (UPF0718 family)